MHSDMALVPQGRASIGGADDELLRVVVSGGRLFLLFCGTCTNANSVEKYPKAHNFARNTRFFHRLQRGYVSGPVFSARLILI